MRRVLTAPVARDDTGQRAAIDAVVHQSRALSLPSETTLVLLKEALR
ncbi:hypothetical protein NKG05_01720 [Oerskovia sp. M15]